MFGIEFLLNSALAIVAFFVFGGVKLMRRDGRLVAAEAEAKTGEGSPENGPRQGAGNVAPGRMSRYETASLVAIAVFIVIVLVFGLDVGLVAFALGMLLHVAFRSDEREVIRSLPWAVVLIIAGVLTYVDLLLKIGTLKAVSSHLQAVGSISLSILALVYFASIFASFESSSVAVLGITIPVVLAVQKDLAPGPLFLVIVAVAFSTVAVSTSPFHLSGALVMGNSADEVEADILFNKLLYWTLVMVVSVPLIGWALAISSAV